jgi:putative FmdB family regulatory protein
MPLYEYRCRECDTTFEDRRPMSQSDEPAQCPAGHEARRVLSVFASVGRASSVAAPTGGPAPMPMGGCGAGCGCHH